MTSMDSVQVTTAHFGTKGEVILPKNFSDSQRLEPGDPITIIEFGNQLILVPENAKFAELSESIAQRLEQAGITEEDLQAGLEGVREEIARKHYPELFSESATRERP